MKTENHNHPQTAGRERWMVVDDFNSMLESTARLLERLGRADISRCRSGAEALAAFNANPGAFTFVVTDLNMPEMDGIELCRALRALEPRLPILLTTGNAIITEAEARDRGFCGLLEKPFQPRTLLAALESAGIAAEEPGNDPAPNHFDPVTVTAAA
jgi:CheY-like chemotaxis protein